MSALSSQIPPKDPLAEALVLPLTPLDTDKAWLSFRRFDFVVLLFKLLN
jgi:hypothetical protein